MKKTFLFLILIFLFNFSFANAEENPIDIEYSKIVKDDEVMQNPKDTYRFKTSGNEPEAQKILYDYVYKDIEEFLKSDDNPDEFTLNDVHAFGYDLDNDGDKEIIGYAISKHTVGSKGITDLYILQKKRNSYEDISRTIFFPQLADIVILEAKHNGYNKIYLESKFVIQYNKDKKHYDWAYTLDLGEYKQVHEELGE